MEKDISSLYLDNDNGANGLWPGQKNSTCSNIQCRKIIAHPGCV